MYELLTTHFRQFRIGSFLGKQSLHLLSTLSFESLQPFYIHKQLLYITQYMKCNI